MVVNIKRFLVCLFLGCVSLSATHPLVEKAQGLEKDFRQDTITEISHLFSFVQKKCKDQDHDDLKIKAFNQLRYDQDAIRVMNEQLKASHALVPAKTNKMQEAFQGALGLYERYFDALMDGTPIQGYAYHTDFPTVIGPNHDNIWGNPKGTYLKTALLSLLKVVDVGQDMAHLLGRNWVDRSRIAHVLPMPLDIQWQKVSEHTYSFCYQDDSTPHGMLTVHSGYAFGGHRGNPRKQLYPPHDCSSFIAELTGIKVPITTQDLMAWYNLSVHGYENPVLPVCSDIKCLEVVNVRDPQRDIRPGQVYAFRTFPDKNKHPSSLGASGHVALVYSEPGPDGSFRTIEYNRSIADGMEGFGLRDYTYKPDSETRTHMFFDVVQKVGSRVD